MTDSSLTTPLPHLKSLYYTHMGGLAVSGSHGLREFFELSGQDKINKNKNILVCKVKIKDKLMR